MTAQQMSRRGAVGLAGAATAVAVKPAWAHVFAGEQTCGVNAGIKGGGEPAATPSSPPSKS